MLDTVLVPIAREGRPFIAAFAVVTLLLGLLADWLLVPGVVLTAWCVYFFRDPHRVTPTRDGLVISPADGRVVSIASVPWPKELAMGEGEATRIGIFMNVFDVHVNRIPVDGRVTKLAYVPGAFVNASFDKASEQNERQCVAMETGDGRPLAFVQIAGLVARRIVCHLTEGQPVLAGERMGMIRFGSRVDVYLPAGVAPLVVEGQRCVAAETVLADLSSAEPARNGAVR
ncbi:phosphatidylserine decarboxylase proenzyme [Thalassobaculum fulvum]|uniref:Phosphatidylserine decarboxylase proenzyme n=1 Tax=Thalassobaculum fulvum TaxID=1633335 RepID=A0A918XWA3_9PROT|nr:phosphatidylserine decarboxylase [Thalassobaculum fulvum]GHD61110.1 phosphatidylserine decarboxylase proenzyme [Thalassobaculum fulvum]